jgi:hypothetical protein
MYKYIYKDYIPVINFMVEEECGIWKKKNVEDEEEGLFCKYQNFGIFL